MNYSDIESIAAIARDKHSAIPVLLGLAIMGFNDLRNSSRHNSQKKAAAEAALARAFNETEGYYAALEAGIPRDIGIEHQLASRWDEAAAAFASININLASRMNVKSEFWRNGAAWSADEVKARGIALSEMREDGYGSVRPTI